MRSLDFSKQWTSEIRNWTRVYWEIVWFSGSLGLFGLKYMVVVQLIWVDQAKDVNECRFAR